MFDPGFYFFKKPFGIPILAVRSVRLLSHTIWLSSLSAFAVLRNCSYEFEPLSWYRLLHDDAVELMATFTYRQINPLSDTVDRAQWFVLL